MFEVCGVVLAKGLVVLAVVVTTFTSDGRTAVLPLMVALELRAKGLLAYSFSSVINPCFMAFSI